MKGFAASPWARRRHMKIRKSRRHMLELQNKHFVRSFLKFSESVATTEATSTFSYESFSWTSKLVIPENLCLVRGFCQFHHISQNATSATEFARCRHLTQAWQWKHATRAAPATKNQSHLQTTSQSILFVTQNDFQHIKYATCWNITKCHACHTKWR